MIQEKKSIPSFEICTFPSSESYNNNIITCTSIHSGESNFWNKLIVLKIHEIDPNEVTNYHKKKKPKKHENPIFAYPSSKPAPFGNEILKLIGIITWAINLLALIAMRWMSMFFSFLNKEMPF